MRVWGFWFWGYCCRSLLLGAVWLCGGLLACLWVWGCLAVFGRLGGRVARRFIVSGLAWVVAGHGANS